MKLKYGSYTHSANECRVSIQRTGGFNAQGIREKVTERWTIEGQLHAADVASLTTAIDALIAAYATDGYDLGVYLDDGVTLTSHFLDSSASQGGTRVVEPVSFPEGAGGEYTTYRNFRVVVEADFLATSFAGILEWEEELEFTGGGAQKGWLEPIVGTPVRQTVKDNTTYKVTQTGRAVGATAYPTPASPIWAAYEHRERRVIRKGFPRLVGSTYTNYPIQWTYTFESDIELTGSPTAKP